MAILDIIQDAALELGLRDVDSVVGSSDLIVRQLLALAEEEVRSLTDNYVWPQLSKEATISLVTGTANYALPNDFDQHIFITHWDRSNHWRLLGPLTAEEWQQLKSGITTTSPRRLFRLKGAQDDKLYIHPTPTASDNGSILVFEYISTQVVKPASWVENTAYTANTYVSYDGRIYYNPSAGTSGNLPLVHTSGGDTDGGLVWVFYDNSYQSFRYDTDTCLLPERLIKLGTKWRFRAARRLDYSEEKRQFDEALFNARTKLSGARPVSMVSRVTDAQIFGINLPDTGYGS